MRSSSGLIEIAILISPFYLVNPSEALHIRISTRRLRVLKPTLKGA